MRILPFLILALSLSANARDLRKKVVVIDSGFSFNSEYLSYRIQGSHRMSEALCEKGHRDFTGTGLSDRIGHGTNIAGIIAERMNLSKYCIVVVKFYSDYGDLNVIKYYYKALDYTTKLKPYLVNMSLDGRSPLPEERDFLSKSLKRGTRIVVAAGNSSANLDRQCISYPTCYGFVSSLFRTVGGLHPTLQGELRKIPMSNYGLKVKDWRIGDSVCALGVCKSGTSQATAVLSAELLAE